MNPIIVFSLASLMVSASAAPAPEYNLGLDIHKQFDENNYLHTSASGTYHDDHSMSGSGSLTYGHKDHSISYQHSETPSQSNQQFTGTVNLYNDGTHKLNANGWWGNTQQRFKRGFEWQNHGGNLEYIHKDGHGASVGTNLIPKFDIQTIDVNAKANLWQSDDKQSAFNVYGTASHNIGTNNFGHTDYHTGLNFEHRF